MMRAWGALRLAVAFLTVLPMPGQEQEPSEAELADSRYAYPVVGLLIGLLLAALSAGLGRIAAPPLISAFFLVLTSAVISGGLHLDGLADSADGLFLAGDPARRLAAMRDPHLGSFGALALGLLLLGKFAALASLADHERGLALLSAAAMSRTLILVAAGTARYARPGGTGQMVVNATTGFDAGGAAVVACVLATPLGKPAGLIVALVSLTFALGLRTLAVVRLKGITGDILGALVELEELAILVTLGLLQSLRAF